MKVLFNTYPMAFHTPGGGEVQLKSYQKYLSDYDVYIGLFDQWDPKFLDFDLVHFFSCLTGSLGFCAFVKSLDIPLIISPNLWITEQTKHHYPIEEIRNQFLQSSRIVVNSDMEGEVLAKVFNLPRDWFYTIYNAADNSFFAPINPDLFRDHFNIETPFVLNVGNIEPRKNQLTLIRAMKDFPELKLVLIGHQRDPDYANACFEEAGEQLHYIEPLAHDSELLRSAYAACDVFALPSTLETPGLAALEAAATGARVVVTSEGSAREYLGDMVDYIEHDNIESIVKGIKAARTRSNSVQGQVYLRTNFTWEQVTKDLANLYRDIQTGKETTTTKAGFYPIEEDPDGHLCLWSSRRIEFEWEPGRLSFLWRSVNGAKVDIIINGERVLNGIGVSAQWNPFMLEFVARQGQKTAQIIIDITPNEGAPCDDPRQLGIAFINASFEPALYSPVDRLFFEPISPILFRDHFNIETPFVLNVGNIEPRKNQLNLIRAMKDFPELKLVLIGHQRDPDYASTCFAEAGEQLHYIEPLAHDSDLLRSAYAACDVFALPSTLETPGLAALEAAAAGARVVVTSEGSAREYFGDLVDYVKHDDLKSIVKGIKAATTRNDTLLGQIYLRANFTWEHVTEHLANLYRDIQTGKETTTTQAGFYPIEEVPDGHLCLWSTRRIEFEWEPGRLSFLWRSVNGATVDIIINNERVLKGIEVSANWNPFTLEFVARQGQKTAQIIIEVTANEGAPCDDPRQLGIALRDVSFLFTSR